MYRYDIINYLITKYNYSSYLELGVEDGDSLSRIKCPQITSVDPNPSVQVTHQMTSDQFFTHIPPTQTFDLIFIDALHIHHQTRKDIANSLNHLSSQGTIVVHDTNPPTEWHQREYHEALQNNCRQWNGTVWKAFVNFRSRKDLITYTVDTDWGCGIIQKKQPDSGIATTGKYRINTDHEEGTGKNRFYYPLDPIPEHELTYPNLDRNRKLWLNLISPEEFKSI